MHIADMFGMCQVVVGVPAASPPTGGTVSVISRWCLDASQDVTQHFLAMLQLRPVRV
jgi:hypothetical protein